MHVDFEERSKDDDGSAIDGGDKIVITFENPEYYCIGTRKVGPNHTRYTIRLNWEAFAEAYDNALWETFMIREALAMQRREPPKISE